MLVQRDPFARQELHKEKLKSRAECDWCGSTNTLYKFSTQTDGGRKFEHKGSFCSVSCYNSYHHS